MYIGAVHKVSTYVSSFFTIFHNFLMYFMDGPIPKAACELKQTFADAHSFWYISSCSDAICCNMQKLGEEEERSFIVDEKFPLENLHVSLHRILQRTCQGAKFCCLKVSVS